MRAIEKPPRHTDQPLRPWLVRVALNLSRDALRRRRRQGYAGPWLPSPIPTDDESPASFEPPAPSEDSPVARYDLKESISFAFLLALEALTPSQRAVLLCGMCSSIRRATRPSRLIDQAKREGSVASRAPQDEGVRQSRAAISPARQDATRRALEQFLLYLSTRDAAGLERLLAEDVVSLRTAGRSTRRAPARSWAPERAAADPRPCEEGPGRATLAVRSSTAAGDTCRGSAHDAGPRFAIRSTSRLTTRAVFVV